MLSKNMMDQSQLLDKRKKDMNYTVVIERQVDDLIEEVNKLVDEGWRVIGGVTQTHDAHFCQALVKTLVMFE